MRFKGNQPVHETLHEDPDQRPERSEEKEDLEIYSSMERLNEHEAQEGNSDPKELGQTALDYSGRTDDEADGVVPAEPPDHNPLPLHEPRPRRTPEHNL